MAGYLKRIWHKIRGEALSSNVFSEDDFWISCLFDPKLETKYIIGVVTCIQDSSQLLIDQQFTYQARTERELRDFPHFQLKSFVRVSLYRRKNSIESWIVSSCYLAYGSSLCHQTIKHDDLSPNLVEPTVQIQESIPNSNKNNNNIKSDLFIAVLGDMPKTVNFEKESTVQILIKNTSYVKKDKLLDYSTAKGTQLSINSKVKLPVKFGCQGEHVFEINIIGKFLGMSTEKVKFIFNDFTYNVGININVTDSRIVVPLNAERYKKKEIDMQRLIESQYDSLVPGEYFYKKPQFHTVKIQNWPIPKHLTDCYVDENGKNDLSTTVIQENIAKCFPATFEPVNYNNYKIKYHTLLFIEEVEFNIRLQNTYAQERANFKRNGIYLVLKVPDLSESRPSLIPGDRIVVSDPPHCTKRLGENPGQYEGIIYKILADEIWLKFDPEFHNICGNWNYSVTFLTNRTQERAQHEVINLLLQENRLGKSFLFPINPDIDYQIPKLAVTSLGDKIDYSKEKKTIPIVIDKIRWFNVKLNPQQKSAVVNILKGEARLMPYIIYGPPGTGKTMTMTEAVIQVYKHLPNSKILICAPTNASVDMILDKLVHTRLFDKTQLRRLLGYNHFVTKVYDPDLEDYCSLPESNHAYNGPEHRNIDSKIIKKTDIDKLRIVITTEGTTSALYKIGMQNGCFSHIFIDEAGQSKEPETLLPLIFLNPRQGGQLVLAGDPKQLGPVVFSLLAKHNGLGQSMLARIINYPPYIRDPNLFSEYNGFNPRVITHLIINYRSLPEIVHNFNKFFYDSLLKSTKLDKNVPERIFLKNLVENEHWDISCKGPVIVHGIQGIDSQDSNSPSWFNDQEGFQVLLYVKKLMNSGILADEIGIITPYISQVYHINNILKMYHSGTQLPKVGTVEMFQGQEKMIIIISTVRSQSKTGHLMDKRFKLGFLASNERTNVALSRAKSLIIIIGDPSSLLCNNSWKYILVQAIKHKNYVGCSVPDISDDFF